MYNEKNEKPTGEELHLKKKYFAILAAALLLFALAVPAFAEPEEETVFAVTAEEQTLDPEFTTDWEEGGGPAEEQTFIAIMLTEPETTVGIVPIDDVLLLEEEDTGLFSQRNLTFGALGLGALALLLSVVALARTRKKTAPNATGNYQKYF